MRTDKIDIKLKSSNFVPRISLIIDIISTITVYRIWLNDIFMA
jgi:hypothetical protein